MRVSSARPRLVLSRPRPTDLESPWTGANTSLSLFLSLSLPLSLLRAHIPLSFSPSPSPSHSPSLSRARSHQTTCPPLSKRGATRSRREIPTRSSTAVDAATASGGGCSDARCRFATPRGRFRDGLGRVPISRRPSTYVFCLALSLFSCCSLQLADDRLAQIRTQHAKTQEQFTAIIEGADVLIFAIDTEWTCTFFQGSQKAALLNGKLADGTIEGKSIKELWPESPLYEACQRVLDGAVVSPLVESGRELAC
jgi:hypothetical protein